MPKLKLTKTASGTMPTQALVDAVNGCFACNGEGKKSLSGNYSVNCIYCTVLRTALKSLTEEVDDD